MTPVLRVDVSICVATYRRPGGIARLLESLGRMKVPDGLHVEVIVVDNDPASPPAHRPASGVHLPGFALRQLREPRRNISDARNRAVDAARGRWLAFVDDDEVVDEGWLAAFWACAGERDCDAFFGPVLPRREPGGPPWLAGFFERPRFPSGAPIRYTGTRTGNAFVRRALFDEATFDPAYGLSGGGDTAFFRGRAMCGARYEWCDEAIVHEWVPLERQRVSWLVRRSFRGGCVHARLENGLGRVRSRAALAALAAGASVALLVAAAWTLPADRERATRLLMRAASQLGQAWSQLGGTYLEYGD